MQLGGLISEQLLVSVIEDPVQVTGLFPAVKPTEKRARY
jgi:hypothetical protein